MLLRLIEESWPLDIVLFYNTGMEFDSIYNLRDQIIPLLKSKGVEFVELQDKNLFEYMATEHQIRCKNGNGFKTGYGWCGGGCRWGTALKRDNIERFKKSLGEEIVDYVGIAADEYHRFEKSKREDKRLPLVEWGMTEQDCLQYCRYRGYNWIEQTPNGDIDLYDILDRVSCWCCRNKNYNELRNIYWKLPRYWGKLRDLQVKIPEPFKKREDEYIDDIEVRFLFEKEWGEAGNKLNTKAYYVAMRERQEQKRSARKSIIARNSD